MDEDKVLLTVLTLEDDVRDIKEKMVTRGEFLEGQDKVVKMLTDIHTEIAATNHALLRHEERIETLEKKVFPGKHSHLA